jgi:hypothetical protein
MDKTLQLVLHGDQQLVLHGDLPHTVEQFSVRQPNASKGSMRARSLARCLRPSAALQVADTGNRKSKDGIGRFANGLSKIMLPQVSPEPSYKCHKRLR